jgi:amidophosphoribosyltransferase
VCGLVGMVFGPKHRTEDELNYYRKVFAYLLLLSEERGPHATGVAWLKRNGKKCILKQPRKAIHLVRDKSFPDFLASVDSHVTWLAGHTRWQTVGDASNNANNHPLHIGSIIGCHNGHIANADLLFSRLGLPRSAEVDSEIIFRMADDTLCDGHIDIAAFKKQLALCSGRISAVMASVTCPEEVVIIKGNMPLEIRYNNLRQVIVYASETRYLNVALAGQDGWNSIRLNPMRITKIRNDCLEAFTCEPFDLAQWN